MNDKEVTDQVVGVLEEYLSENKLEWVDPDTWWRRLFCF